MKSRSVFLFGAGAALPWGGPFTWQLTEIVRKSGFKTTSGQFITEYIYVKLEESGFPSNGINFETIINVIEELIVYHSSFNARKKFPPLLSCFLNSNCYDEIFNFSIKNKEIKHGYQLEIPKGKEYLYSGYALYNELPEQFFLQHLLREIITDINAKIEEYSYHTKDHSVLKKQSKLSRNFCRWISNLANNNVLRLYTLNYDRIFSILMRDCGLEVFEGYECGEFIPYEAYIAADLKRILLDDISNVHFNLHGCNQWDFKLVSQHLLARPEFLLTAGTILQINNEMVTIQVERGKTIMPTSIITGYQKAQKSLLPPFKQMQSAFDKDCLLADTIYIIGYSLGDEHINESLRTAIRYNRELRMVFVDPFFLKAGLDFEASMNIFSNRHGHINARTIKDNLHSYYDGAITIHTVGFEEFLEINSNEVF